MLSKDYLCFLLHVLKAERSDIMMKQNPYKLLYSFEMHRQNWRRAASYIYKYTARLRSEEAIRDSQQLSLSLEERLNGLSAAINALHLVHPEHAWIEPLLEELPLRIQHYPNKRTKKSVELQSNNLFHIVKVSTTTILSKMLSL